MVLNDGWSTSRSGLESYPMSCVSHQIRYTSVLSWSVTIDDKVYTGMTSLDSDGDFWILHHAIIIISWQRPWRVAWQEWCWECLPRSVFVRRGWIPPARCVCQCHVSYCSRQRPASKPGWQYAGRSSPMSPRPHARVLCSRTCHPEIRNIIE